MARGVTCDAPGQQVVFGTDLDGPVLVTMAELEVCCSLNNGPAATGVMSFKLCVNGILTN